MLRPVQLQEAARELVQHHNIEWKSPDSMTCGRALTREEKADMPIFASLLFIVIAISFPLFAASADGMGFWNRHSLRRLGRFRFRLRLEVVVWGPIARPVPDPRNLGQQKSLSWIKADAAEIPPEVGRSPPHVPGSRAFPLPVPEHPDGPVQGSPVCGGRRILAFRLALPRVLLVILVRHLRLFSEPVVPMADTLAAVDGMFEIGVPTLYLSDLCLLAAAAFLLLRRIVIPRVRYISLAQDYIPLLLVFCIAGSGLLMRHFDKIDLVAVKELASGWICFVPTLPEGLTAVFFVHLFCVSALLVWVPLGKLMHMAASSDPTRNWPTSAGGEGTQSVNVP